MKLTDEERDELLLALVAQAQRNQRPLGNDAPCCIVCSAIFPRHAATCVYDKVVKSRRTAAVE